MQAVFRLLLAFVCIAAMAGCATPPDPAKIQAIKRVKQLGVVSVTADVFVRQYTGLTVFNNEHEELAIGDWGVDRAYEEQLSAAVARLGNGRAAVVIADQAAAFSRANGKGADRDWAQISKAVNAACTSKSLDGVLVVSKARVGDFLAQTNQLLTGVGVYSRGPGAGVTAVHVLAWVSLLDCTSGEALASDQLGTTVRISDGSARPRLLYLNQPSEVARRPAAGWSEVTRAGLKKTVLDLPGSAWDDTLRRIFADPAP